MFLTEPPRSQGDLLFRLFNFPVRIHPFFWVVAVLLGMRRDGTPPLDLLTWVAVMLISILVHELGHAFLQRRYGGDSRIVLYGFGGLAISEHVEYTPKRQILISLAGPGAGFLLALATLVIVGATGHRAGVHFGSADAIPTGVIPLPVVGINIYWEPLAAGAVANTLVWQLMAVNVYWGVLNLLPIYPLDGGRIAREALTLGNPSRGIELSLKLSIAASVLVVLYALSHGQTFLAIMMGYLGYSSYQTLKRYGASRW